MGYSFRNKDGTVPKSTAKAREVKSPAHLAPSCKSRPLKTSPKTTCFLHHTCEMGRLVALLFHLSIYPSIYLSVPSTHSYII